MSTKFASSAILAVVASASLLALGACGRESERAARADAGSAAPETSLASTRSDESSSRNSAADEARRPARVSDADVRKTEDGKPLWASNRTRGGEDNAQKQFERNGADFSAANLDDYVKKAHAFVDAPPKTVLTVSRRNGDVLLYDPKANVFAVADREGAPRTMFKPRDGMAYWLEQKKSASDYTRRRSSSSYAAQGDRKDSGSESDSEG